MSISVLCIDDEPGLAAVVGMYLEGFDEEFEVTTTTSAREALELLDETEFDCIVSDYDLPGVDGIELLELVRSVHPRLPFVLHTEHGSEAVASDAMAAGVTDYVPKTTTAQQYRQLARRIRAAVDRFRTDASGERASEHAQHVLDTARDGVVVTVDSRCVYANPAATELLAGPDGDIIGEPLAAFVRRQDAGSETTAENAGRPLLSGLADGAFARDRLVTADSRNKPLPVVAHRIPWDGEAGTVHVFHNRSPDGSTGAADTPQSLVDAVIDTTPEGILVTGADRRPVTYNDQFLDCWGIPESVLDDGTLTFDSMRERVADAEIFENHIETQYASPTATQHSLLRLDDGTVLDQYSAPVGGEDGETSGYLWFFRNVTGLLEGNQPDPGVFDGLDRAAFDRMSGELDRLSETLDRMSDGVLAVDEDWQVTYLNERAEQLVQRDSEALIGNELWSEFPEAVDTEIYDRYHEAVETGQPVSFEQRYDPLDATLEIRAFPSETGLTVYFRDITEQRETQAQLRAAVEVLRELYTIASDQEMSFGEKQQELLRLGASYLDLPSGFVTEIDDGTQLITTAVGDHDLLQPGNSCPLEESYCRKTITTDDGFLAVENAGDSGWSGDPAYELFELEMYIGGRILLNGELYGTVCFASGTAQDREFSEMERTFVEVLARWLSYELEQQSYRAQLEETNSQLEEFASIVSHDLRNPLNVASLRLDLARQECDSDHLDDIGRVHDRMGTLIDDILTLAREGEVVDELADVDLSQLCTDCWDHVDTREATLNVDAKGRIRADESRLAQLVENLVRNAVEHGGDDVTVTVGDLENGFYVEDDGMGIPADQREKLFASGHSTKADGTGIGLRIVEKVADAHGWSVAVAESDAGGARFEFTGVERP